MPSAAEDYDVNLDSGNSIITRHLRAELENRLVMAINCNNEDTNEASTFVDNNGTSDSIRNMCEQDTVSPKLKFPDNLVSVIAGHVIQESSLEPCGLKGKNLKNFQKWPSIISYFQIIDQNGRFLWAGLYLL